MKPVIAVIVGSLIFLVHGVDAQSSDTGTDESCIYDREAMLGLSETAFDQDLAGGWRKLAQKTGCGLVAADLVRDYREANDSRSAILFWHEGQLRAYAGQTERAIELMRRSYEDPEADEEARFYFMAWNLYADATIAFLQSDRRALLAAQDALAELPEPSNRREVDANGNELEPTPWPPNMGVVDRLVQCFGHPYSEAYGRCEQ